MQLAINQWAFNAEYSVSRVLRTASDMGYDAIELCAGEEGPIPFNATNQEIRRFATEAESTGMELTALACASGWLYPITHVDATIRERGIQAALRTLEIAHELNIDTIIVVPGKVSIEAYFDIAFKNACASFERLLPQAERLGVTIALENVRNNFLLSPVEVIHFLNQFPGERVKACLNVGHVMAHGTPENWIQKLGSRIQRIHMRDYKAGATKSDGNVALGTGDVDWPMVMRALHNIGYADPLIADVMVSRRAPETVIHEALVQLRHIHAMIPRH